MANSFAAGAAPNVQAGQQLAPKGFKLLKVTLNPASVAAASIAEQDFTVTGLRADDFVQVNKPSLTANLGIVGCRVKAADTLSITFINNHATNAVDAAAEDYLIHVARQPNDTGFPATVFEG